MGQNQQSDDAEGQENAQRNKKLFLPDPETYKKETMEIAEGHYNNSFQRSRLGRARTKTESEKETELSA